MLLEGEKQNNYQAKWLLGAAGQMNALQLEVSALLQKYFGYFGYSLRALQSNFI